MKIDIKHFALAAAGATMLLTSCIGDLDTLPLNPSDSTSETVYGKDGRETQAYNMVGLFSVEFDPPKTEDEARANPLGLMIKHLEWSKEL